MSYAYKITILCISRAILYFFKYVCLTETIIRCEWSNERNNYTCNSDDGYSCEILENKSLLINIQTDLQPGNFSLQIHRNDDYCICSWNPKGKTSLHMLGPKHPKQMISSQTKHTLSYIAASLEQVLCILILAGVAFPTNLYNCNFIVCYQTVKLSNR